MSFFSKVNERLQEVTIAGIKSVRQINKKNSTIFLLDTISKTLTVMQKSINKVLATKAGQKALDYLEKTKESGSKILDGIKDKGPIGYFKNVLDKDDETISSKETEDGKSDIKNTSPPSSKGFIATKIDKIKELIDTKIKTHLENKEEEVSSTKETKASKGKIGLKQKAQLAKNRFTDTFSKLKDRMLGRKQEIEEEKSSVLGKLMGKKKEDSGWIGKIITAIMGVGGFIIKGLTSSLGFLFNTIFLGKAVPMLVSGLGSLLGGFFKMLPGVGKVAGAIAGATQKGIGSALWAGTKAVGKLATSRALWGGIGQVAVRGGALLLTGPVGIAVGTAVGVAALAYGGYKLYKYLNRNDASSLVKLRLMQYGLTDANKEHYNLMFKLEAAVAPYMAKDMLTGFRFKGMDEKLNTLVHEIFDITEEDTERKTVLGKWFKYRFLPVYMAYVNALSKFTNKLDITELDDLKEKDKLDIITDTIVGTNIYQIDKLVLNEIVDITVTKAQIDAEKQKLIDEFKKKGIAKPDTKLDNKKTEAKTTTPVPPVEKKTTEGIEDIEPEKKSPIVSAADNKKTEESYKADTAPISAKVTDGNITVNKAGGPLAVPESSLQGIRLVNGLTKEAIYNLDPNMNELFSSMAAEYKQITGNDIPVTEAFRSRERQAELYRKYPEKAAKPGNSIHEFGLAVDVDSKVADELDKLGLMRKYGFTRPIGGEKWHLEPIGVSVDPKAAKDSAKGRLMAVEASIGKGGGGYATLDGSVLKRRNIPYQLSLMTNALDKTVDFKDIAKKDNIPYTAITTSKKEPIETVKPTTATAQVSGAAPSLPKKTEAVEDIAPPSPGSAKIEVATAKPTEAYNGSMDLTKYGTLTPAQAIAEATKLTGVDEKTLTRFAELESSMNSNAAAKTSNAKGLFQFVPATWKGMIQKHGAKYNIPENADPNNPLYNSILAAEYIKDNLKALNGRHTEVGLDDISGAYLAHHYGATGALKFINAAKATPNAHVSTAVSSDAYKANKAALGDNTVNGYLMKVSGKFSDTPLAKTTTTTPTPATSISSASVRTLMPLPGSSIPPAPMSVATAPNITPAKTPAAPITPSVASAANMSASNIKVDFSSLETIASKQLGVLETIRELISVVAENSKNNPDMFNNKKKIIQTDMQLPSSGNSTNSNNKVIPNSKVDISRKTYM